MIWHVMYRQMLYVLPLIVDAKVYRELQQDIIDKAKDVFLWVVLMIKELLDGWNKMKDAETIHIPRTD